MIKKLAGVGPVLERFQGVIVGLFPKLELPGLVRASLGLENTVVHVDHFVNILKEIASKSNKKDLTKKGQNLMKDYVEESVAKIFTDEIQIHQSRSA